MNDRKSKVGIFFRAQEYLSLLFFAIMCVLMVLQLLSRYIFSSPLLFTEEFSRLCYVWVAFLGLAVAHRRGDHIKIDLFMGILPPAARKAVEGVINMACIVILAYIGYWGVEYAIFNQWNVAASVDFPLYYVYAALPVGCALGIINIVSNFFREPRTME